MKTRFLSFLLAIVFMSMLTLSATAAPIEFDKKGSISISLQHDGQSIQSGSFTLFQIASLRWNVSEYEFVYTNDFSECGIGFEKLDSLTTAKHYVDYIERSDIEGTKVDVGEYGVAIFTELPVGLYLVIQEDSATGFSQCEPFFITLPVNSDEGWVYEIDATPKINIDQEPIKPPSNIPQTGQLKWPIPVLAIAGIVIFSVGLFMVLKRKKSQ